ncbi:MAG: energy-coupling factor ABC transporter ATP-binding protein [Candidatus Cloacimonetes bacterium]|nr:energy-coupling factor ABC transporter ATP-binding protein [Candidatus Cloacimonadota bacterium]
MESLQIKDLAFEYKQGKPLFTQISLSFKLNDITFLSGANGSGKTTFCRIISGLEKKYRGKVEIADQDLRSFSFAELAKILVYLKQEPISNIIASEAEEDLKIWQFFSDSHEDVLSRERQSALNKYEISSISRKPNWELSGGQLKRIGLAALLLKDNHYWIMDEPLAGLDDSLVSLLVKILKERKLNGNGCLIVSHNEKVLKEIIDQYYIICDQKIKSRI